MSDTRDGNTYTVRKLADGNCWMVENLRLVGSRTLTNANSDVTSNFTLPASAGGVWALDTAHVYYANDTTNGAYYSWFAATAGTGTSSMKSSSAIDLVNAPASICPKGWQLPNGGMSPSKSFYSLDMASGGTGANRTDSSWVTKFYNSPYSFVYSGGYNGGGLKYVGSRGFYWTRSADYAQDSAAYFFTIRKDTGVFGPQYTFGEIWGGLTVRCISK